MIKFVLVVLAATLAVFAQAQEAREILARYSKNEGNTFVTLDKKTFNLIKPMMKLDKETRQLFKLLDLRSMDMLQIKPGDQVAQAVPEFEALSGNSAYRSIAGKKKEEFEEHTDCLFRIEGDHVTEFLMYSISPKDSSLVVMRLDCNSEVEKMKEFIY